MYKCKLPESTVSVGPTSIFFWAEFTNDLRKTETYGKFLKYEFCLILRTFVGESYSNNFIRCLCNRARCVLIHNFLELGKFVFQKFTVS